MWTEERLRTTVAAHHLAPQGWEWRTLTSNQQKTIFGYQLFGPVVDVRFEDDHIKVGTIRRQEFVWKAMSYGDVAALMNERLTITKQDI
ncbi:MAG: hypothetical protein HC828_09440 [Blastochloris sp.]|nr:hypothetical protein [Blastochloris sp.]